MFSCLVYMWENYQRPETNAKFSIATTKSRPVFSSPNFLSSGELKWTFLWISCLNFFVCALSAFVSYPGFM